VFKTSKPEISVRLDNLLHHVLPRFLREILWLNVHHWYADDIFEEDQANSLKMLLSINDSAKFYNSRSGILRHNAALTFSFVKIGVDGDFNCIIVVGLCSNIYFLARPVLVEEAVVGWIVNPHDESILGQHDLSTIFIFGADLGLKGDVAHAVRISNTWP
jgi:hypothetical protein